MVKHENAGTGGDKNRKKPKQKSQHLEQTERMPKGAQKHMPQSPK